MPPIHLYTPICLETLHMLGCPLYVHSTKKTMLCQAKGVSIYPIHFNASVCLDAAHMFGPCLYVWIHPIYVWVSPCMFGYYQMFGCPLHVWMPPICFNTTHMFGCPCMFRCTHMFGHLLYVWTPPVFLDDVWMPPLHTQHKESMLCHTKGVSICAYTFGYPHSFGCLL